MAANRTPKRVRLRKAVVVVAVCALWSSTAAAAHAETAEPTFSIGSFDQSDAEFALAPGNFNGYRTQFPNDVDYTVGSSAPETAWSYVQPGPADNWAGNRTHPFTVRYTLGAGPVSDQLLTLHYRDTNPFNPVTVEVRSNGTKVATQQLPPGNGGGVFGTGAAPYDFKALLPASTLHEGANTLTLTNVAGSWTVYDAVVAAPLTDADRRPHLDSARPTVLFVKDGDVERQLVDVSVTNLGPSQQITFSARAAGATATTTATAPTGVSTQRIKVPPAPKGDPVPLQITGDPGDTLDTTLPYQRRWTFYLDHGSHLDIGYTDLQPRIRQQQNDILDQAVQACLSTKDYPDNAKFRWTVEATWVVQNYLQDRSADQIAQLKTCVDRGQIEVTASYDNNLHDLQSSEQLVRSVYLGAKDYEKRFGRDVVSAYENDSPGVTWQYVQALAKAGVNYLAVGANPTRAPQASTKPSLFWWQAPNGSRLLTWYTGPDVSYAEGYGLFPGGDPMSNFDQSVDNLTRRLQTVQDQGFAYDFYLSMMRLDNRPVVPSISEFANKFDQTYAYPKIVVSTAEQFFGAVEKRGTQDLPTNSGDFTDWWSDGAGSSARETALTRDAQDRTVAAETLGALSSLTTPVDGSRQTALDNAYEQGNLYTEHTWGAASLNFDDPEWQYKKAYAEDADRLSHQALDSSLDDLARRVRNATPWPAVAVFNSLSTTRDGDVQATVDEGRLAGRPIKLLDGNTEVPYQLVSRANGKITLRFVARGVPSVGYKTFLLEPDTDGVTAQTTDPALHADTGGLENAVYHVRLDPKTGAISSIIDKRTGRELVDSSAPFKANEFVYRPNPGGRNNATTSDAQQWTAQDATVKVVASGPDTVAVEVTHSTAPGGAVTGVRSLTERISLTAGIPRVDIANTVDKTRVETPEEAYYAFPFKVDNPKVTYEIPGGQARFFDDQLPGSAMDWQGIWRYADVSDANGGVTLSSPSAPLLEVGRIRTQEFQTRPGRLDGAADNVDPADYQPAHGWLFSYTHNNLWFTNYRIAQEGAVTFRYAITDHAGGFDPVAATDFGADVHTPLYAHAVGARQPGPYAAGGHSLVSTSTPGVTVQTVKRADDGQPGLTVRLLEVAGKSATASVRLPFHVGAAQLADDTERPVKNLTFHGDTVDVPVEAHGIVTVLVTPQLSLTATSDTSVVVRGRSTRVTASFTNYSNRPLSGALRLVAPQPLTVGPVSVPFQDLASGATARATFDVSAPASAAPGPVQLLASASVPNVEVTASQLTLDVVNPVDISASPSAPDLLEGKPSTVTLTATNNLPQQAETGIRLEVPAGWTVAPATKTVTLAAGASQAVPVTVTPPQGSLGKLDLTAHAATAGIDSATTLHATVSRSVVLVGSIDTKQNEFALAPAGYGQYTATFPQDVDFSAGSDDPKTQWSYIQPGPRDVWAGSRDHPFTFRFTLPQAPTHDLTFTAWLVDTQNLEVPKVRVAVNGSAGDVLSLPQGGGDGYHWGDGQPNQYNGIAPSSFDVTLPAAQLKAGENVVTITRPAGSWIVYDAVGVREKP